MIPAEVLAWWWFQLLWTVSHWLHCVHFPDSVSIREVDLELDDGTGKNRSVKAPVQHFVIDLAVLTRAFFCFNLLWISVDRIIHAGKEELGSNPVVTCKYTSLTLGTGKLATDG